MPTFYAASSRVTFLSLYNARHCDTFITTSPIFLSFSLLDPLPLSACPAEKTKVSVFSPLAFSLNFKVITDLFSVLSCDVKSSSLSTADSATRTAFYKLLTCFCLPYSIDLSMNPTGKLQDKCSSPF